MRVGHRRGGLIQGGPITGPCRRWLITGQDRQGRQGRAGEGKMRHQRSQGTKSGRLGRWQGLKGSRQCPNVPFLRTVTRWCPRLCGNRKRRHRKRLCQKQGHPGQRAAGQRFPRVRPDTPLLRKSIRGIWAWRPGSEGQKVRQRPRWCKSLPEGSRRPFLNRRPIRRSPSRKRQPSFRPNPGRQQSILISAAPPIILHDDDNLLETGPVLPFYGPCGRWQAIRMSVDC